MVAVKPTPGQLGLDEYLAANEALITKYNAEVLELSKEYTAFIQDWVLAQAGVGKRLAECEEVGNNSGIYIRPSLILRVDFEAELKFGAGESAGEV